MPPAPARIVAGVLALGLALGLGCGGAGDSGAASAPLRVSAAASLRAAFDDVAEAFHAAEPGRPITLNYAGSSALREQILAGAPVDVFAAADPSQFEPLRAAGLLDSPPRVFAHNRLQLAVPAGNPGGVQGLRDLERDALWVGLCAPGVPCGDRARAWLRRAGVRAAVDSYEPNVRALVTKLEAGELDAGLVYATDVAGSRALEGLAPADAPDAWAPYAIAPLKAARDPERARALVEFVLSDAGAALLTRRGFARP